MKVIQISMDEQTGQRFEDFAKRFHASPAQVAAGLVRAALREELHPERSPVGKGRPDSSVNTSIVWMLTRQPRSRALLIQSFDPGTRSQAEQTLDRMLETGAILARHDGVLETAPKLIPTLTEAAEKLAQEAGKRKRLNDEVIRAFTAVDDAELTALLSAADPVV